MEDSNGGGIVECALAGGVRPSRHEEGGIGEIWFSFEKNIRGLARAEEHHVGFKGLDVDGVDVDDGDGVVGDTEEEFVVECSIDQSE